jgi:hypothetical protein
MNLSGNQAANLNCRWRQKDLTPDRHSPKDIATAKSDAIQAIEDIRQVEAHTFELYAEEVRDALALEVGNRVIEDILDKVGRVKSDHLVFDPLALATAPNEPSLKDFTVEKAKKPGENAPNPWY